MSEEPARFLVTTTMEPEAEPIEVDERERYSLEVQGILATAEPVKPSKKSAAPKSEGGGANA